MWKKRVQYDICRRYAALCVQMRAKIKWNIVTVADVMGIPLFLAMSVYFDIILINIVHYNGLHGDKCVWTII